MKFEDPGILLEDIENSGLYTEIDIIKQILKNKFEKRGVKTSFIQLISYFSWMISLTENKLDKWKIEN